MSTTTPSATPACLFCGADAPGTLTNEHVNPKWLLKDLDLPPDDQLFQGVASSDTGQLVKAPRIHSSFSFVQGRVCDDCNNGWMSRLETAAAPILIPLIDASRKLESLSASDASVVCKWATKTAYLHTWAGPLRQPVNIAHLRALNGDAGAPANRVGVFGMQSDYTQPSAYIQAGTWTQFAKASPGAGAEIPSDAYKVGLQYRHLYLLVAFWPNRTSHLTRARGLHIRLTPAGRSGDPDYPIEFKVGTGPIDRLAGFANGLAVWHFGGAV